MPQYFSPGVYIQEIPAGLQAIQGVSTSIAGLVGPANRGPVPGYVWPATGGPLPFTPAGGFLLAADPAPVPVTSFAQFQRQFGPPLTIPDPSDPTDYGYLAWAVKGYFDNGGEIVYVARIVNPVATPSTIPVSQGVVYRLARSALSTDKTVYLASSRGVNVGDAVTFVSQATGKPVFGHAALPAAATGGALPLALQNGDSIKVSILSGGPAVNVSGTWKGSPASMVSSHATFPGLPGTTLLLTVGAGPTQTILFNGDTITPLSATPTLAEVAAFLSRFASGVTVSIPAAGKLKLTTLAAGTAASLAVGGDAAPIFGFVIAAGAGDVADLSQVTLAEIAAQLAGVTVTSENGRLQLSSGAATGAGVSLEVDEAPVGSGALARLGFGPTPSVKSFGADVVANTLTVAGYNAQQNSISFAAPLGAALDATKVSLLGANDVPSSAPPLGGPLFIARSPGSWSAGLSIAISSADRPPVAATAQNGAAIQVANLASFYVGATVEVDHDGLTRSTHQVTAINQGLKQITLDPALAAGALTFPVASARALEINIVVADLSGVSPTETYSNLAWAQGGAASLQRHYAWIINAQSALVWVQPPAAANETFDLSRQPATTDGFPVQPAGANVGVDGLPQTDDDWIGQDNGPGLRSGVQALLDAPTVSVIAAPGKTTQPIQQALIDQCELGRLYRFAVLDGERDPAQGSLTSILAHRGNYDTACAAYYQPWMTVYANGRNWQLPPSCFVPGVYARVDNARGVWKAPANEHLLNVVGLKTYFGQAEQDQLNPVGVNLARKFDQRGLLLWGARTLSSDTDLMYVNVRRTLNFLEQSIDHGTQWVVFEPNTPDTWTRLVSSVHAFLLTQWRNGALFGRSPAEAFFVICDETTMTSDDILNGRLICQVGVAIVRPAEFVIFRVQQITNFTGAGG
jgi:phage tail sheath protein FI